MSKYPHLHIEEKWQRIWEEKEIFRSEVDLSKPKFYILDMFPYPSGAGLHVGHLVGYTGTDIYARYMRMKGYNVLHPMGWDSFGLPAEQYAIRTGQHPKVTTEQNIATYRRQLKSLGFSYDWSREVATSDPSYYKWTQWIFTKLYEKNLAYEAEVLVNYCPALKTVLANEEVDQGKSKEGGYPIERRPLKQWILKITAYADRLLQDLDLLDWPDSLKRLQANWIGRSEGAQIFFPIENSGEQLTVFTTRQDTLFGVSFLAIAPEHPLVVTGKIVASSQKKGVESYRKVVSTKSDLERTELAKEKTGVWTGSYAINPASGKKIPIWVADYVLAGYGTGVVMGVPGHDERDFWFAQKFNLPVISVITRADTTSDVGYWTGDGILCHSGFLDGLSASQAQKKMVQWLEKEKVGKKAVTYKLRDWLFSRQRYWGEPFPILHFADGKRRALDLDELPLTPPEVVDYEPSEDGKPPLAKVKTWVEITDPKTGKKAMRETNTMPQWAGSCWYYLRFCDPHNTEKAWEAKKENYWMPVDLYVGGVEHAVLHLLYARFWHKVLYDCGYVSTLEPFQRLRNQGLVTCRSFRLPNGVYIPSNETYEQNGGYFQTGTDLPLESQIEKMSKSKLNGVSPDEMIEEFGADTLRLYSMFMGPFDQEKEWNAEAVSGCHRFLNRFYLLATSDKVSEAAHPEGLKLAHRTLFHVEKGLQSMSFNTAIAKMMEFVNDFSTLPIYSKEALKIVTIALYPFAPHISEEIWQLLGGKESLTYTPFPTVNSAYLVDATALYIVQVNGRVRGKYELAKDKSQDEILALIQTEPQIVKHIQGAIEKVVFVPNKLINIVTHV